MHSDSKEPTASVHVADRGALVNELKATPAHLVGNSYGAYIALALAVDSPELMRSLVLREPPSLPSPVPHGPLGTVAHVRLGVSVNPT